MLIKGERTYLGPMDGKAWNSLYQAHLDPEFDCLVNVDIYPMTIEEVVGLYSRFTNPNTGRCFQIFDNRDQPIGFIGLCEIDWKNRNAEFHIGIWDKSKRNNGHGKEATGILIEYSFKQLNLHRLYSVAFLDNGIAKKLFLSMKFTQEAVLKDVFYIDGRYRHGVLFSLINKRHYKTKE